MLSSVYLDAVRKRDTTLLALQDSTYEDIIEKAKTGLANLISLILFIQNVNP